MQIVDTTLHKCYNRDMNIPGNTMQLLTRADFQFQPKHGFVQIGTNIAYRCPGITKLLKQKDSNKTFSKESQDRGKSLDSALQLTKCKNSDTKQKQLQLQPVQANMLSSLNDMLDVMDAVYAQELFLYGNFADRGAAYKAPLIGFADAYAKLNGEPITNATTFDWPEQYAGANVLIDWKSKRGTRYNPLLLQNYKLQLAAYTKMAHQTYGICLDAAIIAIGFADGSPAHLYWLDKQAIYYSLQELQSLVNCYFSKNKWVGKTTIGA